MALHESANRGARAKNPALPGPRAAPPHRRNDVRAAAVSGVLIAATLVLMAVMERVAGISKQFR